MIKYRIECDCGDTIEAKNEEEAIKQFLKKHNFPLPYTKEFWQFEKYGYAEEFEVKELKGDDVND